MLSPPCILLKCVRRYSDFLCRLRRQGEGERRGTRSRQGAKPPLSLTVLGWSHAWHPQGPVHSDGRRRHRNYRGLPPGTRKGPSTPQPHPVPLHVVHPCSYPVQPSPGGGAVPRPVVARGPCGCQAPRHAARCTLAPKLSGKEGEAPCTPVMSVAWQ